ncbi:Uncharacterised protein [Mycobacteroides abscessus subsp. abscessus]|uniref:hypothetical protein n=1 Tax=Mycobacteroides abscessus TaxID=36809 RepID=UPI0005DC2CBC|nr:hypothetical protein [Mycobacteroides abscessus]SKE74376.1 Uncharacterised protein [Mycobacteroides abscessus subsp. bolletii]CPW34154.1 Uncharacterised protein [Mycobacteroides abscessus]SHR62365.1 Uncharacterised protein [Mycobacteroides abscessus subsp. abscessus]SHS06258.1 Uncharacterised protein [Mycobacteroides abscessus subsp. abscessus]SHS93611.1 Uncharacterised protein [Mycobacteroides abscessus subsp. abscessus]
MPSQVKIVRPPRDPLSSPRYDYNGEFISLPEERKCLDCRTPSAWITDNGDIEEVYHDPTCIEVLSGRSGNVYIPELALRTRRRIEQQRKEIQRKFEESIGLRKHLR